jgi:hypothetical protein
MLDDKDKLICAFSGINPEAHPDNHEAFADAIGALTGKTIASKFLIVVGELQEAD